MLLDMNLGELSFKINNVPIGSAITSDELKHGEFFIQCAIFNNNDIVEILNPEDEYQYSLDEVLQLLELNQKESIDFTENYYKGIHMRN